MLIYLTEKNVQKSLGKEHRHDGYDVKRKRATDFPTTEIVVETEKNCSVL